MGYNKVSTGSIRQTSEELKNNSRRQSLISNTSGLLDPNHKRTITPRVESS